MSIIKDTFFGGAEKKAAQAQQKGIESGIAATEQAARQARKDLGQLFPQARQDVQQGFQGALDIFGQSLPAQTQAFQQGNVGAQQTLINALPQMQNAILGGQIDLSAFQPQQVDVDTSFFQQQLPRLNPPGVDPSSTGPMIPDAFAPGTQFQGPTNSVFGNLLSDIQQQAQQPPSINTGADMDFFRRGPFGQRIQG